MFGETSTAPLFFEYVFAEEPDFLPDPLQNSIHT
jgi:hypothetical protein